MIHEFFSNQWRQRSHLGLQRFIKRPTNNDNVQALDTKWDEVLSAITERQTLLDAS